MGPCGGCADLLNVGLGGRKCVNVNANEDPTESQTHLANAGSVLI